MTAATGLVAGAAAPAGADSRLVPLRREVNQIVIPVDGVDAGVPGHIGADLLLGDTDLAPCLDPAEPFLAACAMAGSYYKVAHWGSDGYLQPNVITIDNADNGVATGWADKTSGVHLEVYPYGNADHDDFDPWTQSIGGAHLWVRSFLESGDGTATAPPVGVIPTPTLADGLAFRVDGTTLARSPLPDGRLRVDLFQITGAGGGPLPAVTGAYPVGAFTTSTSEGDRWTGGVVWPGTYSMYVFDYATGRIVNAFVDLAPGRVPIVDLDAVCFGLDPCQYVAGRPPAAAGAFHPVTPARILDTRLGVGIAGGPVRPGDGRSADPSFGVRRAEWRNHELSVAGVGGVPPHGATAVLVQLTGAEPDTEGAYLSVYPKPPRRDLWNDRTSFAPGEPAFSNVNVPTGEAVANLVYVPLGAGGRIRLHSRPGAIDAIADVVGWFDGDGSGQAVEALPPARLLDTRIGTGGERRRFAPGETRAVVVAGRGGVPADATAAVVNITADRASVASYVTVWPSGQARPDTSALNPRPGPARSGLATVPLGADGALALYNAIGNVDLIVDVVGYVTTSGSDVSTAADPSRLVDTRISATPLGPGESRSWTIGGVPPSARAVWLNVTGTNASEPGYLTVWPSGGARPDASNLNVVPDHAVANLVLVPLGPGGSVDVFNARGTTDLLVDLAGYVT